MSLHTLFSNIITTDKYMKVLQAVFKDFLKLNIDENPAKGDIHQTGHSQRSRKSSKTNPFNLLPLLFLLLLLLLLLVVLLLVLILDMAHSSD